MDELTWNGVLKAFVGVVFVGLLLGSPKSVCDARRVRTSGSALLLLALVASAWSSEGRRSFWK